MEQSPEDIVTPEYSGAGGKTRGEQHYLTSPLYNPLSSSLLRYERNLKVIEDGLEDGLFREVEPLFCAANYCIDRLIESGEYQSALHHLLWLVNFHQYDGMKYRGK